MSQLHWTTRCPTGVTPKAFRFDPYGSSPAGKLFFIDESELRHDDTFENTVDQGDHAYFDEPSLFQHGPPVGTRHPMLWGRVSFVPYPDEEFVAPSLDASLEKKGELVRVFLGQLPYFVTDMQLSWLCYTFGLGNAVALPERIMKKQPNGERLPTGCIHAYTTIRAVEEMAAGMHKRMLVDDTGVWHARSDMELDALSSYVACMKSDRTKRVPGRPYDTVVVQLATSTFVPMNPTPLTEFPTEFRFPHGGNKLLRGSPPPPSYDSTVTHILAPPPPYNPYTA